jgi:hypothetical protein
MVPALLGIVAADNIFAQQFSPARTAAAKEEDSIDWLLLMPKNGTTPTGIFAGVDYIQRIATKGGKAPATPPGKATDVVEVKYKAVYRLLKRTTAPIIKNYALFKEVRCCRLQRPARQCMKGKKTELNPLLLVIHVTIKFTPNHH